MLSADLQFLSYTTLLVCTTLAFVVRGLFLWWLVNRLSRSCVRSFEEHTQRNVSNLGSNVELVGLLGQMRSQSEAGDFQRSVSVDPNSEVGQIAAEYNRVLERVNAAILRARSGAAKVSKHFRQRRRRHFSNDARGTLYQRRIRRWLGFTATTPSTR